MQSQCKQPEQFAPSFDLTMTTAADQPALPPPLTVDLAEPILAICVHLVAAASLWQPAAIYQPLAVLSRAAVPLVTKAALINLPDVDLTWATERGDVALLDFMLQWSTQPNGRPINYASASIAAIALECGKVNVLEWWLDMSGLIVHWDWNSRKLVKAFCGQDAMQWLKWWKTRGFPYLDEPAEFAHVIVQACRQGRMDVLDWLLENVGAKWIVQEADSDDAIKVAAEGGHVHVLDWWIAQSRAGLIAEPDLRFVFSAAVQGKQVEVLEWCKQHPQVIKGLQRERLHKVRPKSFDELVYPEAIRNGLAEWFSDFGLIPFVQELEEASVQACAKGDLELVKLLHTEQHLVGLRKELIEASMVSGNLELLDWIQSNIDSTALAFDHDLFAKASQVGNVAVLDWLVARGYKVPASKQSSHSELQTQEHHEPSPLGHILVQSEHIAVLDWLLASGCMEEVRDTDVGECLVIASKKGNVKVLDWFAHNFARPSSSLGSIGTLPVMYFVRALNKATKRCHLDVLDWWLNQLSAIVPKLPAIEGIKSYRLSHAFEAGRVDIIEWWLHKSGPLKSWLDADDDSHSYLRACKRNWSDDGELLDPIKDHTGRHAAQLAAVQVWMDAKQPMDLAKCIHTASIYGRIDLLDWLLKTAKLPIGLFVQAWTSSEYAEGSNGNGDDDDDDDVELDDASHAGSLLWWRANLAHVCRMPVNRGPYIDPLHAHILEHVLHNTSFALLDTVTASERGYLSVLEFRRNKGNLSVVDLDLCLIEASWQGMCHVLDWWKREMGTAMKCPQVIAHGEERISKRAKHWWAKSGLVSEKEIAQMKV
ncbi:hypothetical protein BCR44DRAFT_328971 [Catenaria anguillulae PL171]|uniref:Ankyrin repeat-containing domain protein n=1 Tax=Catenaria anguillulae PL171 TaxID=765915 RepID=A0A1Y2HFD2_9FUNG|nr:hypothetical protein BCR44DRAFT_328971 [Catenaria anguillulae PL171]